MKYKATEKDSSIITEDKEILNETTLFESPTDSVDEQNTPSEADIILANSKRFGKKGIIIISITAFVLAALLCVSAFFINDWRNGNRAIPSFLQGYGFINTGKNFEGVSINGISVEGLTKSETKKNAKKIEKTLVKKFELTINANGKSELLTEKSFNFAYNTDDILKEIEQYRLDIISGKIKRKPKNFVIKRILIEDSVNLAIDNIATTLNTVAINSVVSNVEGSTFQSDGQKGSEIDKEDLRVKIIEFINSEQKTGTIDAKVNEVDPITVNAPDGAEGVTVLATFSTISTNNANGNHNMKLALKACDGSIIQPGATWSFNAHTGNSNLTSLGYKPATVIAGGKYQTGIGGGICQASTTIYNAALYAGLQIAERHCHLWASSYAKAGFDATIDYPGLDLKLKNPGNKPVYLKCSMSGNKLTVTIFGHKSDEYDTIQLNSRTTQYVAGEYYRVAATRTFLKNGTVVRTENLTSSRYSLKKAVTDDTPTTDPNASQPATPPAEPPVSSSQVSSSEVSSSAPSSSENSSSQTPPPVQSDPNGSSSNVPSSEPATSLPEESASETP